MKNWSALSTELARPWKWFLILRRYRVSASPSRWDLGVLRDVLQWWLTLGGCQAQHIVHPFLYKTSITGSYFSPESSFHQESVVLNPSIPIIISALRTFPSLFIWPGWPQELTDEGSDFWKSCRRLQSRDKWGETQCNAFIVVFGLAVTKLKSPFGSPLLRLISGWW